MKRYGRARMWKMKYMKEKKRKKEKTGLIGKGKHTEETKPREVEENKKK